MSRVPPSVFARDDTMLGVCEALGEDFGFNANALRIALALGLFFHPAAVGAAYAAGGLLVLVSRWLAPDPLPPEAEACGEADESEPCYAEAA